MATLQRLCETVREVMASERSSFYRDLYARQGVRAPRDWEDWQRLPFLGKRDIQSVPYRSRLYVPESSVARIHQTSGTTGAGITIMPRTDVPYAPSLAAHFAPQSYIGFMYPHSGYDMFTPPGARLVCGDTARPGTSAALAAHGKIDGIAAASASFIIEFASYLAAHYDLSHIAHLLLQSDVCTTLQRRALKELYPNAHAAMIYLCSEMQGVAAFPPKRAIAGEPNALVSSDDVHIEFIDGSGAPISKPGIEGELIVSMVRKGSALPLLRYRPGDRGMILGREGEEIIFKIIGRTTNDRLRLSVGQIVLRELERAIEKIAPRDAADFQATLRETSDTATPYLSILFHTVNGSAADPFLLARGLEKEIHITTERTYADGIARGICAPISCSFGKIAAAGKPQRLVDARVR